MSIKVELLENSVLSCIALRTLKELCFNHLLVMNVENVIFFKWVCHHQKGGSCWNSVGNSRSTTLEQRLPLHVLIMTNTIRELMCLVLVSQRTCRLIWNNTYLQRRFHEGNFGALSSLPLGTQKTGTRQLAQFTELCSRQISRTV